MASIWAVLGVATGFDNELSATAMNERVTKVDPDQYLHKLVMSALTLFVVVILFLAAFITREIWLQQRIVGLSSSLQTNLEELEQTTEEIQSKMSELESTTERAPETQEWDNVNELLEDVDQQLESIEETMDEVVVASEEAIELAPVILLDEATSEAETVANTGEDTGNDTEVNSVATARVYADQVFTIFAVLIGIAGIAIAILLGMAIRVDDNRLSV